MAAMGFVPDFRIALDGAPMPAELRTLVGAVHSETGVEGRAWPAMTTAAPSSSSCSVEMEKRELQPLTKLSCGLSGSLHAAAAACTAIW